MASVTIMMLYQLLVSKYITDACFMKGTNEYQKDTSHKGVYNEYILTSISYKHTCWTCN